MDLSYTAEQQRERQRFRSWLREHVPAQPLPSQDTPEGVEAHRSWERELNEAGLAAVHWPVEYGGRGAGPVLHAIFEEEYIEARAPRRLNRMALGLIGPAIMEFGTNEQKARFLPAVLNCEHIWCQGFSEPEAGSDLASLRTRAVPDGTSFRVSGQKIWTSLAGHSDWMFALVRTNKDAPRHHGLTTMLISLRQPGVDVRPIRQLDGESGYAEVFLDDVRVPAADVLGPVDGGWRVAQAALVHERATGVGNYALFCNDVRQLVRLARRVGRAEDDVVRSRVAGLYADTEVFRAHMQRIASTSRPDEVDRLANLTKLFWSEMEARIFETARWLLGSDADRAELGDLGFYGGFTKRYWQARAAKIYAGTNEIQRNVVAKRVLNLGQGSK